MHVNGKGYIDLSIQHRNPKNGSTLTLRFIVVTRISSTIPQYKTAKYFEQELTQADLADSVFNVPGKIDMLLGVGV